MTESVVDVPLLVIVLAGSCVILGTQTEIVADCVRRRRVDGGAAVPLIGERRGRGLGRRDRKSRRPAAEDDGGLRLRGDGGGGADADQKRLAVDRRAATAADAHPVVGRVLRI